MKGRIIPILLLLCNVCRGEVPPAASTSEPVAHQRGAVSAIVLKERRVGSQALRATNMQSELDFNRYVLKALSHMPVGGGYSVKAPASKNLSTKAVVWNAATRQLSVNGAEAQPSFCSGACYVVLLHALKLWQQETRGALPAEAWKACDVHGQADGSGIWGRANANGPGFAKLVHDLDVGDNFSALEQARRGDFLKFFWTEEIGSKERGHMVVFLGVEEKDGQQHIRYWSSNMPDGYSERSIPLRKMHHLIFTRVTRPGNFSKADRLPAVDGWLKDMQKRSVPFAEVAKQCGIGASPRHAEQQ